LPAHQFDSPALLPQQQLLQRGLSGIVMLRSSTSVFVQCFLWTAWLSKSRPAPITVKKPPTKFPQKQQHQPPMVHASPHSLILLPSALKQLNFKKAECVF
jgi:hypothetical protein